MKKVLLFPPFFAFLSLFTLFSYADDAGTSGGLDVGQTILYVVLVLAFCAGLLIISKWSAKIRQRDEQLAMERAKFEEEQRQNGSSEASAEGEGEAAEAEEAEEEEEEEEEEEIKEDPAIVEEPVVETVVKEEESKSAVLGESLKLSAGLRHSISLNDSFRFSRELFGGNTDLMNRVIEQISVMSSYKTAVAFLSSKVELNEEKEAVNDFLELLKKYFNQSV